MSGWATLRSSSKLSGTSVRGPWSRTWLGNARIIITGASRGIGEALARRLAYYGAHLCLAARSAEQVHRLAQHLRTFGRSQIIALGMDVTNADDRKLLIESTVYYLGGLDVLVNNAGVGASGLFEEGTPQRLRQIMETNFFAAAELMRLAIPHLARSPLGGMIVNVSSVLGRRGVPGYGDYCASKFALTGLSEALRAELVRYGIHVLTVSPGLIDTPFNQHMLEQRFRPPWRDTERMSASQCAREIVSAMLKRKNELVITAAGRFLVWANRLVPGLVDWVLAKLMQRYRP
ncbi:MAG: SDR family oxidoreductase [Gemmatales bacterium]|nr:SDR family oxidoreductase [Gemmatales bacterium]MDW8222083.1 SDR family oxidoreductase [Gemmatales bacterium]